MEVLFEAKQHLALDKTSHRGRVFKAVPLLGHDCICSAMEHNVFSFNRSKSKIPISLAMPFFWPVLELLRAIDEIWARHSVNTGKCRYQHHIKITST